MYPHLYVKTERAMLTGFVVTEKTAWKILTALRMYIGMKPKVGWFVLYVRSLCQMFPYPLDLFIMRAKKFRVFQLLGHSFCILLLGQGERLKFLFEWSYLNETVFNILTRYITQLITC